MRFWTYLVKHRAIGTDVSSGVVHLLADGSDTTRTKSGGAGANDLGQAAEQLKLGPGGLDTHLVDEHVVSLLQVLVGVVLDVGQEGGVERVGLLERADVSTLEELDLGLLVEVDEDETEKLAEVETGDHLLESLLARARRLLVDDDVVLGARQDLVLVVEGTPLAVDGHEVVGVEVHVGELGDVSASLHVGGVAASAEDATDLHLGIRVGTSNHGTGGVVDQGGKLDGHTALLESLFEGRHDVLALDAVNVETLGPALEDAVVDVVLGGGVGEGETKRELVELLALVVVLDELLETVGDVAPKLVGVTGLELLGHAVLGLDDVELALLLGKVDLANTEVGAAHVKGKERTGLVAGREAHAPGRVHGNVTALLGETLLELGDEVVADLLELGGVNDEQILQSLDLLHQVVGDVGHGALAARRPLGAQSDHLDCLVGVLRMERFTDGSPGRSRDEVYVYRRSTEGRRMNVLVKSS